jgi:hypothetical protein
MASPHHAVRLRKQGSDGRWGGEEQEEQEQEEQEQQEPEEQLEQEEEHEEEPLLEERDVFVLHPLGRGPEKRAIFNQLIDPY